MLQIRFQCCCIGWEGWRFQNPVNHTSWVAVVISTNRPKSVRNRCVIKVEGTDLCNHFGFFLFSVGMGLLS